MSTDFVLHAFEINKETEAHTLLVCAPQSGAGPRWGRGDMDVVTAIFFGAVVRPGAIWRGSRRRSSPTPPGCPGEHKEVHDGGGSGAAAALNPASHHGHVGRRGGAIVRLRGDLSGLIARLGLGPLGEGRRRGPKPGHDLLGLGHFW